MEKIKYRIVSLVVMLILFFIVKEAYMTQIAYINITLEQVVQKSNCIIIAKKANPSMSTKEVNITPVWKSIIGKKYPPFTEITYHFIVNEILYAENTISEGISIDVFPANQEKDFMSHKEYCLRGIGKSPIYEAYNYDMKKFTFKKDIYDSSNELILFLNTKDYKTFTFVAEHAYESINLKEKVVDIIKNKNNSGINAPGISGPYPE